MGPFAEPLREKEVIINPTNTLCRAFAGKRGVYKTLQLPFSYSS